LTSPQAIKDGVDCQPNMPIFIAPNHRNDGVYRYWRIDVNASQPLLRRQNITAVSGLYSIYFLNCAEDTSAILNGQVVWFNPFGYLSGSQMPFMMVYLFLACAYFVLFVLWSGAMVYNRASAVRVQLCIHAALLVSFCEYFIYSGDWGIYNYETGYINVGWNVATVIVVAQRATVVGITGLLIAMGYGLFRRQLKRRSVIAIIVAAIALFISTGISQLVQMLRYTPQTADVAPPEGVEFLFVVAETFVNFCVAIWSLYHLYRSTLLLKKYRQFAKLVLFRRLIGVVVFALVTAALIFLVDFFASVTGAGLSYWRAQALFGASWPLLWFIVVIAIVALFWPNDNNQLFTMYELPEDDPAPAAAGAAADTEMRSARNEPQSQRPDETIAPAASAAADDERVAAASDDDNNNNNNSNDDDDDGSEPEPESEEPEKKPKRKSKKKKAEN